MSERDRSESVPVVILATELRDGDTFLGTLSGNHGDGQAITVDSATRDLKGRVRVDFGMGVVRTYEPRPQAGGAAMTPLSRARTGARA